MTIEINKLNRFRNSAFFITLIYFIVGISWIAVSGVLVSNLSGSLEDAPKFELFKGMFFILATSALLYLLIRRNEKSSLNLRNKIAESNERWKSFFESANDPVFILSNEQNILEVNRKAELLYGYTRQEFLMQKLEMIQKDTHLLPIEKMLKLGRGENIEYNSLHIKKSGETFPAEISISRVNDGTQSHFIYTVHDLSLRRSIQEKLIESEEKYRTIVETSHELIWSINSQNVITYINKSSLDIYGLEPEYMIGKKFGEYAASQQTYETTRKLLLDAISNNKKFIQYESIIIDSKKKQKVLLTNCIINYNSSGAYQGMIGSSLDITEKYEAGERIKQLNKVYSLMTNMNQLIVRANDNTKILQEACRLAVKFGMFRLAWIGIPDKNTGKINPLYSYGGYEDYLKSLEISLSETEEKRGPIIRAVMDNIYYVSNDVETDSQLKSWRKETLAKGFRSFAVFPIEVKNKVVAVYNIYSEKKNFFGKAETELLLELAEDISFALEYIELEKERTSIENRYKNIVERSPIGIFTQLNETITFINPAGYKMLGASAYSEVTGRSIYDVIHQSSIESVNKRLKLLKDGSPVSEIEEKFIKTDGSVIDVMVSAIPYQSENQNGAQVFFTDLTEQKENQRRVLIANERFKMITKATNDILWDWDLKTGKVWWNDSVMDLLCFSEEEMKLGMDAWYSRINPNDKERIINGRKKAISSGHEFWFDEYSFNKGNKVYAYVFDRGYIIKDDNGKPTRMVGSILDISFRKKMELELKKSEERWRSIFENSPSIIFTIDKNLFITGVNAAFKKLFGGIEIPDKNSVDLISNDEQQKYKDIISGVFREGMPESFNITGNTENNIKHFSVQAVPIKTGEYVTGITVIATDITEKIKADRKINESNEQLHALAAHLQTIREEERTMISREIHDQLGQELTALKMDIAFLSRKIEKIKITNKPDWNEITDGLRSMSDITDQTINSIRRIARELRPDVLDKLGLKEAIEWQAEEFTKRTGIDCIVSVIDNNYSFTRELENTIFRIIQESLTNVARHSKASRAKVGLTIKENFIFLSIEDNGIGITDENIKNTGSLGLVGIKERAYSVKGKLKISGEKNKGTNLSITIPIKP